MTSTRASHLTGNVTVLFDADASLDTILQHIAALLRGEIAPASGPSGDQPDWHEMAVPQIAARLSTSVARGLTDGDATKRLSVHGPNQLEASPARSAAELVAAQFTGMPVAMLAGAAAISLVTGALVEAIAIAAVLALNGTIGFATESRAEATIQAFSASGPQEVQVLRDGATKKVPAAAVVPGDVLLLQRGTIIAADARVVDQRGLAVSESALTGESRPIHKTIDRLERDCVALGDRTNMVYRGTVVTSGSGSAFVVATGGDTEMGRVQRLVAASHPPETPSRQQLNELGRRLAWLTGGASLALFLLGSLRGFGTLQMARSALSLAVASVPEGLPMIATTTQVVGLKTLRKHGILVRRLEAIETLACVDVVCFDKTGTLTANKIAVEELAFADATLSIREGVGAPALHADGHPTFDQRSRLLLEIGSLCSLVEFQSQNGQRDLEGSATETALARCALDHGIDVEALRRQHPRAALQERSEAYRFMATTHRGSEGGLVAVKGSPEEVLARCRYECAPDGRCHALTAQRRAALENINADMASRALRVLGFAYTRVERVDERLVDLPIDGLTWIGFAGLKDQIRPGARELVDRLHRAGITTVMLTGDQPLTARAVALQIGLAAPGRLQVLDTRELDLLPPSDLAEAANRVHVFARVTPAQKLTIVRALQQSGNVVAMIGDGINDSPALRAADVGLAMGLNGEAAAREVADIFLHTEDLTRLALAIEQGRTTHANIQKSLRFLLGSNSSEIIVMLVSAAVGSGQALTPLQLLWINLLTDVLPGIGLALERPDPEVMDALPQAAQRSLGLLDTRRLLGEGAVLAAGALTAGVYGAARYGAASPQMRTLMFGSLVGTQLLHAITCRSPEESAFENGSRPSNETLNVILGASGAVQAGSLLLEPVRRLLGLARLGWLDVAVLVGTSALPFMVNQRGARKRPLFHSTRKDVLHFRRSPPNGGARSGDVRPELPKPDSSTMRFRREQRAK